MPLQDRVQVPDYYFKRKSTLGGDKNTEQNLILFDYHLCFPRDI